MTHLSSGRLTTRCRVISALVVCLAFLSLAAVPALAQPSTEQQAAGQSAAPAPGPQMHMMGAPMMMRHGMMPGAMGYMGPMGGMGGMGAMGGMPWESCGCGMMGMGWNAKTPKATGERLELRGKLLEMRGEMMKAAAAVMQRYAKDLEHSK